MIVCMAIAIRRGMWTFSHSISMGILVLCFLTEIYIYLFVIQKYDIVGDLELIMKLFTQ